MLEDDDGVSLDVEDPAESELEAPPEDVGDPVEVAPANDEEDDGVGTADELGSVDDEAAHPELEEAPAYDDGMLVVDMGTSWDVEPEELPGAFEDASVTDDGPPRDDEEAFPLNAGELVEDGSGPVEAGLAVAETPPSGPEPLDEDGQLPLDGRSNDDEWTMTELGNSAVELFTVPRLVAPDVPWSSSTSDEAGGMPGPLMQPNVNRMINYHPPRLNDITRISCALSCQNAPIPSKGPV